ncbi:hypothetical protein Syun_004888 [Stephania yunnanensis]|uniref:Probable purine permease n=1 Tax=Stephania yunnanensis TaxID=152371 RepID=A0AAP0L427_9MAGN
MSTTPPENATATAAAANPPKASMKYRRPLLLLSCIFLAIGLAGAPLLVRLYYIHGGKRRWLITTVQTAGFPLLLIPITSNIFISRSRRPAKLSSFLIDRKLAMSGALMGLFFSLDNFLFSLGLSYLPLSTSTIIMATQLVFIAVFARLIVKQRFTAYSVNSVALMVMGCVLLGVRANGDRPPGVSNRLYLLGFFMTLACAALVGALWPCMERCLANTTTTTSKPLDFCGLFQFQFCLAFSATVFSVAGMLANKDFQVLREEAKEFGLGSSGYCLTVIGAAVLFIFSLGGGAGVIFIGGAFFSGIVNSVFVPITDIVALILFGEAFTAEKGMALALCSWGLLSYFYGEYRSRSSKKEVDKSVEPIILVSDSV